MRSSLGHMARCIAAAGALCSAIHGMRAAVIDRAKATSPMETLICSDKDLTAADTAMNAAYQQLIATVPPAALQGIRDDQRQWLADVQRGCGISGPTAPAAGNSAARQAETKRLAECSRAAEKGRTEALKHSVVKVDGIVFITRSLLLLSPDEADDKPLPGTEPYPGYGSLALSWPQAASTDPRWLAWNRGVVRQMQRGVSSMSGSAKGSGWQTAMADGIDSSVNASAPEIRNGRVTLGFGIEGMGHSAAHPYEGSWTMTWLLDEQRPLTPLDVFRPGSAWKQTMATYAWRQLRASGDTQNFYEPAAGAHNPALLREIADVANWELKPDGIAVEWPEYSLAPRVFPVGGVTIPWSVLKPLLRDGFTP